MKCDLVKELDWQLIVPHSVLLENLYKDFIFRAG